MMWTQPTPRSAAARMATMALVLLSIGAFIAGRNAHQWVAGFVSEIVADPIDRHTSRSLRGAFGEDEKNTDLLSF